MLLLGNVYGTSAIRYDRQMIRLKLKELLAEASFRRGERILLDELAAKTGIHRATLSSLSSPRGCNTSTDNLDRLCHFFDCKIEDLVEYIPSEPPAPRTRTRKPKPSVTTSDTVPTA